MTRVDPNHVAYCLGDKKYKEGLFAEAAKYFLIALQEWPEDWQAMHALGNSYTDMKKPRQAEKWFRQAIEPAPTEHRFDLIYNFSNAIFDQDRFDEAIATYRQVPRGHAVWPKAERNLALCHFKLGK